MRNNFLKLLLIFSIVASFFVVESNSFAATIDQPLTAPDAGWKRYDSDNLAINYEGKFSSGISNLAYKGHEQLTGTIGDKIKITFKGNSIRLISGQFNNRSNSIEIYLDGALSATISQYGSEIGQVLRFEKTGLTDSVHTIEMVNKTTTTNTYMSLDAVDINDSGYLIAQGLTAEGAPSLVNLSWDGFIGGSSYNILRSLTPNGPYTQVGTSDSKNYSDSSVDVGTTYYYIVTTVNSNGEVVGSNEASATPTAPPETGRAILTITMTNGLEKEYDLSMTEVNNFIEWFDAKDAGTGPSKYAFNKTWNKGPFKARTEYVIFDKILTFDVDEYDPVQ